jgi:signal transduction histidine kinase/CheY-like chemotaxis protein
MTIRWKLFLTITLALAINLAVGYYAAHTYSRATASANLIRDNSSETVATALTIQVHFKKQVQEWKNILLRGHEDRLFNKYKQQFEREEQLTHELTTRLLSLTPNGTIGWQRTAAFLEAHARLGLEYRKALNFHTPSNPLSHLEVDRSVRGIDRQPTDLIDEVVAAILDAKEIELNRVNQELGKLETRIVVAVAVVVVLTILFFVLLANVNIARPINLATRVARRISQGELSGPIPPGGGDEAGQLLQALATMQGSLLTSERQLKEEQSMLAHRVEERTQELNIANSELARAAKAKDLFLATMSHELRTPLTTILGLTEMIRDQLYGPVNKNQEKALATVDESSRHLLTLINDILDVAKVESGKMELNWDYIPVEQLIEASLRLIKQPAQRKHLQVEYHIDPAIRLIHGDSRRLKQLLLNLLSNAVKFTPEESAIGIDVGVSEERELAHFSVWDTGIGIDELQQKRLFEPFVQLDSELTRRYSGTGLGLTLVNRMALLHGGTVEVESIPGKGSRFTVNLPWKPADNMPNTIDSAEPSGTATDNASVVPRDTCILLAEDNAANREMIAQFLQHQGFRVITAVDGIEALHSARDNRPDLILMDVQLEGMSGLEVTERLRKLHDFSRTPIIALTALAMPGDRENCLDAGMDDYLSKPVGLKEIHERILSRLQAI